MELCENIRNCRNILCKGYSTNGANDTSFLNDFCGQFNDLCSKLQGIISNKSAHCNISERIFLSLAQAVTCIKFLEKAIRLERVKNVLLNTARKHFLDRILLCLAKIESAVNTAKDDVSYVSDDNCNIVDLMDDALELLSPYLKFKEQEGNNNVKDIKEVSEQVGNAIECMLSQILAFANIALVQDKKAITALCQKVLRECIEFRQECSNHKPGSQHILNFKASVLEAALLRLEEYLNESLLRLVFRIFIDYSKFSIDDLRCAIKSNPDDSSLDDRIADFDINGDRAIQVGLFATAYASKTKARTIVRSCLASFESLDSCLIPSIYSQCIWDSILLEEHFHEEIKKFRIVLQEIIDTKGFSNCFIDIITAKITEYRKNFKKGIFSEIIDMADILKEHIEINSADLKIDMCNNRKKQYEVMCLMINECKAILACADQVEPCSILKRLKILRSAIEKFKNLLENISKCENKNQTKRGPELQSNFEDISRTTRLFETFGITPAKPSVFYKSYKSRDITDSLKGNHSKLLTTKCNESTRRNKIKRTSLRTAMFKQRTCNETENIFNAYNNSSTSLQITDILEQLTSLPSTLS